MSFVITMYVREGIVMASDSRTTLSSTQQQGNNQILNMAVGQSDSNNKLFLAPNNIGILTFGAADIAGVPIAGYIESFMVEELKSGIVPVNEVAQRILLYFQKFTPPPATGFFVAGYLTQDNKKEQHVWIVDTTNNKCEKINPPNDQGAQWAGEADILTRIIQPVGVPLPDGRIEMLPHFQIPWQFFTLQDAIDFCVFAVRSTIDAIRFQPRPKTVGGPIDVLIIKPDQALWIQRKELHA
jgi:hypothetical protein